MKKTLDIMVRAMVDMEAEYEVDLCDAIKTNAALQKEINKLKERVQELEAQLEDLGGMFYEATGRTYNMVVPIVPKQINIGPQTRDRHITIKDTNNE